MKPAFWVARRGGARQQRAAADYFVGAYLPLVCLVCTPSAPLCLCCRRVMRDQVRLRWSRTVMCSVPQPSQINSILSPSCDIFGRMRCGPRTVGGACGPICQATRAHTLLGGAAAASAARRACRGRQVLPGGCPRGSNLAECLTADEAYAASSETRAGSPCRLWRFAILTCMDAQLDPADTPALPKATPM